MFPFGVGVNEGEKLPLRVWTEACLGVKITDNF